MPTYEYRCNECGHKFEKFQRITAEPEKTCPVCAGSVEKLISAGIGLIFKGSGFYITDYRSESYKKAEKAENDSGGSESASKDSSGAKEDKKEKKESIEAKAAA